MDVLITFKNVWTFSFLSDDFVVRLPKCCFGFSFGFEILFQWILNYYRYVQVCSNN